MNIQQNITRPRILIITNRYPPNYIGGYEIACQSVTERLRSRGYEILVLTSNYGINDLSIDDFAYRLLHRPQDSSSLLQLARWEIADNRLLRNLIKNWKPDLIYAWSMLQLFPSLYLTIHESKIPLVFNVQDYWIPQHLKEGALLHKHWQAHTPNILKNITKSAIKKIIKQIDQNWLRQITINDLNLNSIIFCSRFQQTQHIESGLPLGDSCVIYNGIDFNIFNNNYSLRSSDKLRILFVGRLVKEKGAHIGLKSIVELNRRGCTQASLSIAGVPSYPFNYQNELQEIVDVNGLQNQVRLLGMVQNHELPKVYGQHDVLIFPSVHIEGLPVTILEAMACGLTVVGTTIGGSSEILIDEVNSLTIPTGDEVALADCLERLYRDRDLVQSLASRGQSLVREKFDIDKITDETIEYLYSIV